MVIGTLAAAVAALVVALAAQAPQTAPPSNLVEEVHRFYYMPVQNNILRAAEQFPEDKYTWQPTPEVRTWGRLIGHLIDDNNFMCYAVTKDGAAPKPFDQPPTASPAATMTKAALVAELEASIERCNKAFASLTPGTMNEPSGLRPGMTKIGALIYNTSHTNEHYGNLVTYMRLQGLVPPSSAGRGGRGN